MSCSVWVCMSVWLHFFSIFTTAAAAAYLFRISIVLCFPDLGHWYLEDQTTNNCSRTAVVILSVLQILHCLNKPTMLIQNWILLISADSADTVFHGILWCSVLKHNSCGLEVFVSTLLVCVFYVYSFIIRLLVLMNHSKGSNALSSEIWQWIKKTMRALYDFLWLGLVHWVSFQCFDTCYAVQSLDVKVFSYCVKTWSLLMSDADLYST